MVFKIPAWSDLFWRKLSSNEFASGGRCWALMKISYTPGLQISTTNPKNLYWVNVGVTARQLGNRPWLAGRISGNSAQW